jgi:AbrB family looped-hinge helix DNA binding protein
MAQVELFKVSTSGQMCLPAGVRRRWNLTQGGIVEVLDVEFGVLVMPIGGSGQLLNEVLPAEVHYAAVAAEEDPDLVSR